MEKMKGTELIKMLDEMVGKHYIFSFSKGMIIHSGELKKERNNIIDSEEAAYSISDSRSLVFLYIEPKREYVVDTTERPTGIHVRIS